MVSVVKHPRRSIRDIHVSWHVVRVCEVPRGDRARTQGSNVDRPRPSHAVAEQGRRRHRWVKRGGGTRIGHPESQRRELPTWGVLT